MKPVQRIVVVGSGTAGLISALQLKSLLPGLDVSVVSSSDIPIVGVGEGSTEHWAAFERRVGISRRRLVRECDATYKFGIRFKDWTSHTPDYFHSIGNPGESKGTCNELYSYLASQDIQLTVASYNKDFPVGYVRKENGHGQTNQFHFDTFKLNSFLADRCNDAGVEFIDAEVTSVNRDPEHGDIVSLGAPGQEIPGDFFIDATGWSRSVLSGVAESIEWISFSDYLPCDSAIAFPTLPRENGILPYTIATALSAGWRWELPTSKRRGNGYVYSSAHCTFDEAVREASAEQELLGPVKSFNFDPGYVANSWEHNCCAIGLSSGFVEPLEATSIAASIQQSLLLSSYLPIYRPGDQKLRDRYLRIMDSMMENMLAMIALHYVSDRNDSPMWRDQQLAPRPPLLEELLDIWQYRGPEEHDVPRTGFELFGSPHFWHVALGQGVININNLRTVMSARQKNNWLSHLVADLYAAQAGKITVPHAEALQQ
jgi:tryptophan halogenase